MFWQRKKPQNVLQEFDTQLQAIAATRLRSLILFGSHASGEAQLEHSDLNVLAVFDHLDYDLLCVIGPVLRRWQKTKNPAPVLLEENELPQFARAFPIEFLDIKDHHRVLAGQDVLTTLAVDQKNLRAQIEHDLALHQLRLRQALALAHNQRLHVRHLLSESIPSVLTLLRAVLRLYEDVPRLSKLDAALRLAERLHLDASPLRRLADTAFRRQTDNLRDISCHYLALLESVLHHLEQSQP